VRLLRTIHTAIVDFCGPLVWSLSQVPDLMLRMITAACAGLIVVCVFHGALLISHKLFPQHEAPVVTISDIPYAEDSD
jgi:hypothetical protein